jgi:seryl-tRNA synthetase
MLDPKLLRTRPQEVREAVSHKKGDGPQMVDQFLALDERRRRILSEVEALRARRNAVSAEVGRLRKAGKDASDLVAEMRSVSDRIQELDAAVAEVDDLLESVALRIPNIPHESVPIGPDETANLVIRSWGELPSFDFHPRPHWEIGMDLGIMDSERATKLTGVGGVGFSLFRGQGARLQRALISLMLDLHSGSHGYTEIWPPALGSRACMIGTGQIPKMEEDMYRLEKDDLFLIPTAEVPLTNLHREEILEADQLPLYYAAYTPCFRREAGAAGRDTRGLLRVHQFDKVELVKVVRPETSYEELESLVADAEGVLRLLELPYRVVLLSTGDMTFSSAKTYDLEVWAAGVERWLEVSSCSNFEAFQARRMALRYRPAKGEKPELVHTLNGSGVALPRVVAALIENNQQQDGSVVLPKALRPYMGGVDRLTR